MDLLAGLVTQMGRTYETFIPVSQAVLSRHKITHMKYDILVAKVIKGYPMTEDESLLVKESPKTKQTPKTPSATGKKGALIAFQVCWSNVRLGLAIYVYLYMKFYYIGILSW